MSKHSQQEYRIGTGASVMLLIFMIVCLSALGMLALLSARADLSLSRRGAQYAQAYYSAQDEAERIIRDIARDTAGLDASARAQYASERGYTYENEEIIFSVPDSYSRQVRVAVGFTPEGRAYQAANTLENIGEWDTGTLNLSF